MYSCDKGMIHYYIISTSKTSLMLLECMNICGFVERYAQKAVDVRKAVSVSGRQDKQQTL